LDAHQVTAHRATVAFAPTALLEHLRVDLDAHQWCRLHRSARLPAAAAATLLGGRALSCGVGLVRRLRCFLLALTLLPLLALALLALALLTLTLLTLALLTLACGLHHRPTGRGRRRGPGVADLRSAHQRLLGRCRRGATLAHRLGQLQRVDGVGTVAGVDLAVASIIVVEVIGVDITIVEIIRVDVARCVAGCSRAFEVSAGGVSGVLPVGSSCWGRPAPVVSVTESSMEQIPSGAPAELRGAMTRRPGRGATGRTGVDGEQLEGAHQQRHEHERWVRGGTGPGFGMQGADLT
jgi:hypothetical protein